MKMHTLPNKYSSSDRWFESKVSFKISPQLGPHSERKICLDNKLSNQRPGRGLKERGSHSPRIPSNLHSPHIKRSQSIGSLPTCVSNLEIRGLIVVNLCRMGVMLVYFCIRELGIILHVCSHTHMCTLCTYPKFSCYERNMSFLEYFVVWTERKHSDFSFKGVFVIRIFLFSCIINSPFVILIIFCFFSIPKVGKTR